VRRLLVTARNLAVCGSWILLLVRDWLCNSSLMVAQGSHAVCAGHVQSGTVHVHGQYGRHAMECLLLRGACYECNRR
jgi:hypothetical protein